MGWRLTTCEISPRTCWKWYDLQYAIGLCLLAIKIIFVAMGNLIIIGARAMGRETFSYARDAGMTIKGFLDSNAEILNAFGGYAPILGLVEDYSVEPGDVFVCALGEPEVKRKYVGIIAAKGGMFASVIHPTAYVGQNVQIGTGCIVCPHATITNDTSIGSHVVVNVNASINHDCRIGDFTTICPGCHLAGRVTLGDSTFLGVGVSLIPDVSLGKGVYVAAGATVTKSFERGRLKGTPATLM